MSDFVGGLEGVIAVETDVSEVDAAGGMLRYRGVAVSDLVGRVTYGHVWSLLVDDEFNPALPPAEPFPLPVRTGDIRVDVQSALAQLAPVWGFRPLIDIDDARAREDLARASVLALSYVAQAARGSDEPRVSQREIDRAPTTAHRFLTRWRGEPDPRHVEAIDTYWVCTAEHGTDASALTARVVASTGADVAACLSAAVAASSGPLHGGAQARVLHLIEAVEKTGDPHGQVTTVLDRGRRLMGFGHRVYRSEDPRAAILRETARRLHAPRFEVAAALEQAALSELTDRYPDRALGTNVDFWAAVVLDFAQVPSRLFTPLLVCARTAGWAAHVLEQKRHGRLLRPAARYTGVSHRRPEDVAGWDLALARGQVR
jgi:citrate synthase